MAQFNTQNGYEADCDVIYGDTDSVMVDFRVCSRLLGARLLFPRHPSSSSAASCSTSATQGSQMHSRQAYEILVSPHVSANLLVSARFLPEPLLCDGAAGAGHRARHGAGARGGRLRQRHLHQTHQAGVREGTRSECSGGPKHTNSCSCPRSWCQRMHTQVCAACVMHGLIAGKDNVCCILHIDHKRQG